MSNRLKAPYVHRRSFLAGLAALAAAPKAEAAFWPQKPIYLNALDFGVIGDGVTNDATSITNFFNFAASRNAGAYFPQVNYQVGPNQVPVPDNLMVLCEPASTFLRSSDPANPTTFYNAPGGSMFSLGNRVRWSGGTFTNNAVYCTS